MKEVVKQIWLGNKDYNFEYLNSNFVASKIEDGLLISCSDNFFKDLDNMDIGIYWLEPQKTLFSTFVVCLEYLLQNKVNKVSCVCKDTCEVVEGRIEDINKAVFKKISVE